MKIRLYNTLPESNGLVWSADMSDLRYLKKFCVADPLRMNVGESILMVVQIRMFLRLIFSLS